MENNKGKGIFYGVIGVATLVVAIIGATFAFFAASSSGTADAIKTGSSEVKAFTLTEKVDGIKSNLIPVNAEDPNFKNYVGSDKCTDDNGNNICSVYQVTVKNDNTNNVDAYFSIKPSTNTFESLNYAVFEGTPSEWSVTGDIPKIAKTAITGTNKVELTALNHLMTPAEEKTYTIVLWIQESGADQTTTDANKTFAATFTVATSADGTNGVTGVISANGAQ